MNVTKLLTKGGKESDGLSGLRKKDALKAKSLCVKDDAGAALQFVIEQFGLSADITPQSQGTGWFLIATSESERLLISDF